MIRHTLHRLNSLIPLHLKLHWYRVLHECLERNHLVDVTMRVIKNCTFMTVRRHSKYTNKHCSFIICIRLESLTAKMNITYKKLSYNTFIMKEYRLHHEESFMDLHKACFGDLWLLFLVHVIIRIIYLWYEMIICVCSAWSWGCFFTFLELFCL